MHTLHIYVHVMYVSRLEMFPACVQQLQLAKSFIRRVLMDWSKLKETFSGYLYWIGLYYYSSPSLRVSYSTQYNHFV